ncbi:HD domain-containing protein [Deinococcus maricopensis]|uniref:Polynucleotide adenylyltransferase/metal dependent phosphohydrolase n=1 Tax=Deinococcus maricopensis (strain DSM 21211 / LMG 22137 / NRRL B-23946 / LB-34) TaxID=709986 RepID=E8U9K8_DEIML|nr:HD domain-containing protein [Deinococcus maricopensis]ADV67747.1 polynucleotide adenylyltransferase/metal dependent phosphohydrolase [Deinococcus maricopensis DSM 21211]
MFRRPRLPAFPVGALLVGGAARDLLSGRTPKDFDWAAPDPEGAARAVAAQTGGSAFPLDPDRGYWRVSAGDVQHDFVPQPDRLEDDLLRRDFTVNALALHADGRVTDPTGGRRDLQRRQLRMVSEANLRADPLRLLRAARLSTTLGFRVEPATEAALRHLAAANLPLPAPERVREELNALLLHPDAARGVLRLQDLGLLRLYLPELAEGEGVSQGGFHHLDVLHHGIEALHQLLARSPDATLTLRWATLLHDVGKPRTRAVDPTTGRVSYHGHDRVGADLTRALLTRLRFPADLTEYASALVKAHMLPLPADEREARRFVYRRRALLPDLLSLMLADREAARGPSSHPGTRLAYARAMDRVLAALDAQPEAPRPLLNGADIMTLLSLTPGPEVGAAARALAEAQALGEVITPADARALLQTWHRERSVRKT